MNGNRVRFVDHIELFYRNRLKTKCTYAYLDPVDCDNAFRMEEKLWDQVSADDEEHLPFAQATASFLRFLMNGCVDTMNIH